jgi:hypothetical protein
MSVEPWQATAFNPATESTNQIHSDEIAKAYGFRGGLVPGVTISSYLMHPAALAWGEDWLTRGTADITVLHPLYDGLEFTVDVQQTSNSSCEVQLIDSENHLCASGRLALTSQTLDALPNYQDCPVIDPTLPIPDATPVVMKGLRSQIMKALRITWNDSHNMAFYLKNESSMAAVHRPSVSGFAHGGFLLGITNWVLMGNVYMNPWLHLQRSSQYFKPVSYGTELVAECNIVNLFEKKGHDFVDLDVNLFEWDTKQPVMSAQLRAIYRMRPA